MSQLTLVELKERLHQQLDPDVIVDLLQITSEELVEAFSDKIEEIHDKLERAIEV